MAGGTTHPFPPLFILPSWIYDIENREEYLSHLPPAILAVMVTISMRTSFRGSVRDIYSGAARQRMTDSEDPWTHVIATISAHVRYRTWSGADPKPIQPTQMVSDHLTNLMRRKELHKEECLRLLRTLSELRTEEPLRRNELRFIGICLPILMGHATKWDYRNPPDIVLLEAVVTLAAISCTRRYSDRLNILSSSRDYPWLLLNIRNTNLISTFYEGTPPGDHKQLTSLLFLVVYAFMYRGPSGLAVQYFTTITAKGDLPLYASALTAIAPSMTGHGLYTIGMALLTPRTGDIRSIFRRAYFLEEEVYLGGLFKSYDRRLGASENPDPNIFAILLMLSKQPDSYMRELMQNGKMELKNPWLSLAARVAYQLDIPDGLGLPMGLFHDHRVRNMIATLSLLQYARGKGTDATESLLLASFLKSRELSISSAALEYYMKTTISYFDSPAPAPFTYLSAAVSSAFDVMLPETQLWRRWALLDIFVDGFETLSVEWRRNFAEGFFTLSRRPLLRPRGDMESSTQERELEAILTWEYFHAEEQEPELTDSHFSGLDWMAMAWSLRLSQQSRGDTAGSRQGKTQLQNSIRLEVNEEFVLRALCKLLAAAPYSQIIHIIPKLREFVQWFDSNEFPEYRSMISTWINETVRWHEEFRILHGFRTFHCTWDI